MEFYIVVAAFAIVIAILLGKRIGINLKLVGFAAIVGLVLTFISTAIVSVYTAMWLFKFLR